ncbi:MAG TPA: cupin domain-containing protein [Candidatus Saccharimonadales bacterium]|jgi:hypothetical protein|nr:cupin domain-containing protein [Candidatus Saccharimonadales bacterium]
MNDKGVVVNNPDSGKMLRHFKDGSTRNVADLPSVYIGKGIYKPGWRWSLHAGPQTNKVSQKHIGYVLTGKMHIQDNNGKKLTAGAGDSFEVGTNHDAWVIGNEPCVALDFEFRTE